MEEKKAFTLVELLVVVAIISLLILGTSAYVNKIKAKSRDAQRLAHIHQIITAIEMYHNKYGHYPDTTNGILNTGECIGPPNETGGSGALESAISEFIKIPKDPRHNCNCDSCNSDDFFYAYDPDVSDCGPAVSINKFETTEYRLNYGKRATDQGDMNIGNADFNWCFGK